jgi:hypothetical protein
MAGDKKLLIIGVVAVVAIASVATAAVKFTSENEFLIVVTGSMDAGDTGYPVPTIPVNSLVTLRYLSEDELQDVKIGDVLGYRSPGRTIVHRVVDIDLDGRTFTLKGDANISMETVQFGDVVGTVTGVYTGPGNLIAFLRNGPIYVITELVCLYVMVSCMREILQILREEEETEAIE